MSDEAERIAGLRVVLDPDLPPGVAQLRDGFGSIIWEWSNLDEREGVESDESAT